LKNDVPNPWDISTPEARIALTARTQKEGKISVSRDYLNGPRSAPWREHARAHGLRTLACLPLRRAGEVIGVLMLAANEVSYFEERLLTLPAEMTADISFALDNIDRDAAHLESTREVEAGLARFAQLFQAAPVASAIPAVENRRVVAVNDAMRALHRSAPADMIGQMTTELTYTVVLEDRDHFYEVLHERGRARNLVARRVDETAEISPCTHQREDRRAPAAIRRVEVHRAPRHAGSRLPGLLTVGRPVVSCRPRLCENTRIADEA
jgi:GAF domain